MKTVFALGLIAVMGFIGYQLSGPLYDAAARSLCIRFAVERQLTLEVANGMPEGRLGFRSFPDFACRFSDRSGSTFWVDENDGIIEPTWRYRGLRALAVIAWVSSIAAGVGLSSVLGLMKLGGGDR